MLPIRGTIGSSIATKFGATKFGATRCGSVTYSNECQFRTEAIVTLLNRNIDLALRLSFCNACACGLFGGPENSDDANYICACYNLFPKSIQQPSICIFIELEV